MRSVLLSLVGAGVAALLMTTASGAWAGTSAPVDVSPGPATFMGEVSVQALQSQLQPALRPPVEAHRHLLPKGRLTSDGRHPNSESLQSLPPNAVVSEEVAAAGANPLGFTSTKGFVGIHSLQNSTVNGFELEPPDQGFAVNNNVAMEINNLVVQTFNATTGASLSGPIAVSKFFLAASGNDLTDTQVFYDPSEQRWYLTVIESNSSGTADIDLAVSKTSSATGSFYIYHINAFSSALAGCGGINCFPDYPKAGYDANGFYVSVDLFGPTDFVAAATYAMPKIKMIKGAAFTYARILYSDDFVVQPSVPAPKQPFVYAGNGTEYLMTARGSSVVRIWAISNTRNIVRSISTLRAHSVDVTTESYGTETAASTEPDVIGPYCAAQGVTSAPTLDGGYLAFQSTIQLADGGKLFGVLDFSSPDVNKLDRDILAWFALQPSITTDGIPSATIFHQNYLTPPTGYSISYGAFGLEWGGKGVIGMTITNRVKSVPGGFPSTAYVQFTGTSTTGKIIVTGKGVTSDDGFTGCGSAGPGTVGRWGDYGAATVDAATGYFYTANENISGAAGSFSNWGTYITQLH